MVPHHLSRSREYRCARWRCAASRRSPRCGRRLISFPAGLVQRPRREASDVAGNALARRRGDEVKGGAGLAGAALDDGHEAAQAAEAILLFEARDFGLDRADDLVGQHAPGVPGHVAEKKERKDREDDEIDERELERRRAKELAQGAHRSRPSLPARIV